MRNNRIQVVPERIITALGGKEVNDLDPAYIDSFVRPHQTARIMFTPDKGYNVVWKGTIWLNASIDKQYAWVNKLAKHDDGIMLIKANTHTKTWKDLVFPKASGILFLSGDFYLTGINSKQIKQNGSWALVSYGTHNLIRLIRANHLGTIIKL